MQAGNMLRIPYRCYFSHTGTSTTCASVRIGCTRYYSKWPTELVVHRFSRIKVELLMMTNLLPDNAVNQIVRVQNAKFAPSADEATRRFSSILEVTLLEP